MIKLYNKQQLDLKKNPKMLTPEIRFLQDNRSPFITHLLHNFTNNDYLIYVMKYIDGISLCEAIRNMGLLSSFDSQFFTALILMILQYLRDSKMIH